MLDSGLYYILAVSPTALSLRFLLSIVTNVVIAAVTGSVGLSQWRFSAVVLVKIARSVAAFCKIHSVEVLRDYALVCKTQHNLHGT